MTRNDAIMALAEYFDLTPPENIYTDYDWLSGCSMRCGRWLSLTNVIEALDNAYLFEEEDD